jgi:hypothetical protein
VFASATDFTLSLARQSLAAFAYAEGIRFGTLHFICAWFDKLSMREVGGLQ